MNLFSSASKKLRNVENKGLLKIHLAYLSKRYYNNIASYEGNSEFERGRGWKKMIILR